MKIIIDPNPSKTRILTDSGEDITAQLHLQHLKVEVEPSSVRVELQCCDWSAEGHVDPTQVAVKITDQIAQD